MNNGYEKAREELKYTLARVVKKRRRALGKSISKISDEIGMTKSMWVNLERGIKDPQLSTIWRVAEALNISAGDLLNEVKDNLPDDFSLTD